MKFAWSWMTSIAVMILFLSSCSPEAGEANEPAASNKNALTSNGNIERPVLDAPVLGEEERSVYDRLKAYFTRDNLDEVTIRFGSLGNVESLWGDGLAISTSAIGCTKDTLDDRARCFMDFFSDVFGATSDSNAYVLARIHRLKNGSSIVRFNHQHHGIRVLGSTVSITFDESGDVTHVYSEYFPGLTSVLDLTGNSDAYYEAADRFLISQKLREHLKDESLTFLEEFPIVLASVENEAATGKPCLKVTISDSHDEVIDAIVDLESYSVVRSRPRASEYAASPEIWSEVKLPALSTTNCDSPKHLCFTLPPATPLSCSFDFDPELCVESCSDSPCGTGWGCWDQQDPNFEGYCYAKYGAISRIYDEYGWSDNGYADHIKFFSLKWTIDQVIDFQYDEMGREHGFSGYDHDYGVQLVGCCASSCPYQNYNCTIPAYSTGYKVFWYEWPIIGVDSTVKYDRVYNTLGHEFGHNVVFWDLDLGWLSNDECMNEIPPQMLGASFSVKMLGGSQFTWTTDCGEASSYTRSPWNDELTGLEKGCTRLPYAHRSRLDWLPCDGTTSWGSTCEVDADCEPYEDCAKYDDNDYRCTNNPDSHNNRYIWTRFIRVLAEGTSTFSGDGNSENVGVSFTGVTRPIAVEIIDEAIRNLSANSDLSDWIDLLLAAGSSKGKLSQVRMALGIAGFISYWWTPVNDYSDRTPYKYYFSSWTPAGVKYFYAYKDDSSYDIRVFYADSQSYRFDTISANTDHAPAMVEFNTRLYIFWRDRTTNAIKYSYYTSGGWKSGIYDLNSKNIRANGSFDAAVFNGKLYLVAAAPSTNDVFLARCDSSPCTSSSWHDYDPSPTGEDYTKELGYDAFYGMGAVAIDGLHGASAGEHLYVVARSISFSRIRIDQVDTSESINHTYNLPTDYPSYQGIGTVGVKAVVSAFPSAGKYLHLTWADSATGRIHYAAVQNWDETGGNTWVTRSANGFILSSEGVRLMKGDGESPPSLHFSYLGSGGVLRYAYRYGRY